MKQKKAKFLLVSCILVFNISLQAQETLNATGGETKGAGGNTSYVVGEITYTTITGTSGSVSQGTTQPYEISTVSGIEEADDIVLNFSVHPNPVSDFLKLTTVSNQQELTAELSDQQGKIVWNQKINNKETIISTANLPSSIYFLKVSNNQKEIKTFKIVKNQ